MQRLPLAKGKRDKIMKAIESSTLDGQALKKVSNRDGFKILKGMNLGMRIELWKHWQHFAALPIDERLLDVLEKSLSKAKADRYQHAKDTMAAISLVIDDAPPDMKLREKIPTKAKDEVSEQAQKDILNNVGCGLLNHGFFPRAMDVQKEILGIQPDHRGALNGLYTALALLQMDEWGEFEDEMKEMCDGGVEAVVGRLADAGTSAKGRTGIESTKCLAALWAMGYGNGEIASTVAKSRRVLKAIPQILDDCGVGHAATALMCLGLMSNLAPCLENRDAVALVLQRLPRLLSVFADDKAIMIRAAYMMGGLCASKRFEGCFVDEFKLVLESLVGNWRGHHIQDEGVCHAVMENLGNFIFSFGPTLCACGVPELARRSLEMHGESLPVTTFGRKVLDWWLCRASDDGDVEAVEALLKAGADKDAAVEYSDVHPELSAENAKAGGSRGKKGVGKWTPLLNVCLRGHGKIVKLLLEAGADVNKVGANGGSASPLFAAAQKGNLNVVKALLEAGAEKDKAMEDGRTPLLFASYFGHADIVAALLQAGADKLATFNGQSALEIARQKGHSRVVSVLEGGPAPAHY